MVKWLAAFAALIALIAAVAYYMKPETHSIALANAATTMNASTSWRIQTVVRRNNQTIVQRTHEANCPDQEHIVEEGSRGIAEYVRLGDDVYYKKGLGPWVNGRPDPDLFAPFPSPRPCLTKP